MDQICNQKSKIKKTYNKSNYADMLPMQPAICSRSGDN